MDILVYLKETEVLTRKLGLLVLQDSIKDRLDLSALRERLAFDRDYLVPELVELSQRGRKMAKTLVGVLTLLDMQIVGASAGNSDTSKLPHSLALYGSLLCDQVMPLIRSTMSTQDREELYQLYLDVSDGDSDLTIAT